MSDSVRPHRQKPTRLPRPWDSPGKNTGVGCHFLPQCMKVKSESEVASVVSDSSRPPWTAVYQAPPSMGFSKQEYWKGVSLPSPISHYWAITHLLSINQLLIYFQILLTFLKFYLNEILYGIGSWVFCWFFLRERCLAFFTQNN